MENNQVVKDYLWLHLIVLIWGFTAILGVLISLPSLEIVFFRTLMASLGLLIFLYVSNAAVKINFRDLMKFLFTGGLIAAHWVLFFLAAQVSTVSVCLAGMATCSLWTAMVEPALNGSKVIWYEMLLGILVVLGLYIIFRFESSYVLGLTLAVASAVFGAFFMVINGRLTKKHNPYVITFYEMAGACILSLLLMPIYAKYYPGAELNLSPSLWDWFWLLVLSQVCTVFAFSISVKLMKRLSAFSINLTTNMEPVYGILLAIIIFGEQEKMTGAFYIGTGIILLSVCFYPIIHYIHKKKVTRHLRRLQ
ncbi:MAG: EamA family transporter [Cyclobacteriaceae bacterium]